MKASTDTTLAGSATLRGLALLVLVFTVLWFGTLDYRKLIKTDEGRYAEISREMAVSGDWVTPRLNGLKYFEKPPLQYWAGAATMVAFGAGEWQARMWTALTGFLAVLLLAYAVARLFGSRTALYSAAVLGSSALWVYLGHINTLDMGLAATMSMALCGVMLAEHARQTQNAAAARNWMLFAWAGMALAVLSKGLIGIVLPGGAVLVYVLIWRDWALLRHLHWLRGLVVFFAITAPWFVLVSLRNPEFAPFFFVHEHFERFLTPVHRRTAPPWYFFPILVAGLLPWTGFLPRALWRVASPGSAGSAGSAKSDPTPPAQRFALRFALVWTILIFAFFSFSSSKLASYILPIFPAVALLIGHELQRCSARHLSRQALLVAVVAVAAMVALQLHQPGENASYSAQMLAGYRRWLMFAAVVAGGAALAAAWWARAEKTRNAIVALAGGAFLAATLSLLGHEQLSPSTSGHALATRLSPLLGPKTPIYSIGMYEHSLGYYLQRTLTLVAFRDEMDLGLRQEPHKGIPTIDQFAARWENQTAADQQAIAIVAPDNYEELLVRKLTMHLVYRDARRIVVARTRPPLAAQRP